MSDVIVVIHYESQAGQEAVTRRELSALIKEVVAKEPDCLGIQMHQDLDDPTRLLLYERWTSREAYTGPHMNTPHITAFKARAASFAAGPPSITFWTLTDDVTR